MMIILFSNDNLFIPYYKDPETKVREIDAPSMINTDYDKLLEL